MKNVLVSEGVAFHGGFRAGEARAENGEKVVTAGDERGEKIEVRAEEILVAAGRAPTAGSLALENAGIELQKKGLKVDEHLRTTDPNVYAAGDITGKYLFTHVAEYQGRTALRNALFPLKTKANHRVVPWTTFTDPEVARVGLTEQQAREEHGSVKVYRHEFTGVDRALADGETTGFVKVVTGRRGKILGGHIIGPDAGNLIHEVVLAMQRNVPIQALSTMIHVYPTLSQANRQALAFILEREAYLASITQAGSLAEARRMLDGVDAAVIDPTLPDGDGLALIADLRKVSPGRRVLVLLADDDPAQFAGAARAGADGILSKAASLSEVIEAVHCLTESAVPPSRRFGDERPVVLRQRGPQSKAL